jgi:hypothetical protein
MSSPRSGSQLAGTARPALKASRKPIKLPTVGERPSGLALPVRAELFAEPGQDLFRLAPGLPFFSTATPRHHADQDMARILALRTWH